MYIYIYIRLLLGAKQDSRGLRFLTFRVCFGVSHNLKQQGTHSLEQNSGGTKRATSVNMQLLRLQSSEGSLLLVWIVKPSDCHCTDALGKQIV